MNSHAVEDRTGRSERDFLLSHLEIYLGIYKHHFDLFVKGIVVYMATVSALAGFIFRQQATPESQLTLSATVSTISAVALFGFFGIRKWIAGLESMVKKIEARLGPFEFPFSGARRVVDTATATAGIFVVGGLVNIWFIVS